MTDTHALQALRDKVAAWRTHRKGFAVCGIDCRYGDENCNDYCCGNTELPPRLDALIYEANETSDKA